MIGADEHGGPSLNRLDRVLRDKHRSGATSRQPDRGGDGFPDPPLSRAIVDDSDHGCEAGRSVEDRRYEEFGSALRRERVCQYVVLTVVRVSITNIKITITTTTRH